MSELKPCPFCGRQMKHSTFSFIDIDAQVIGHDDDAQILCPLFRGITWFGSKEEAITLWNRRAE